MQKQKQKPSRGGLRNNSGRKPVPDDQKKKARNVYLTDAEKAKVLAKHDSLTAAILTTIKPQ